MLFRSDLGDRPLRVFDIPGHTPGSIALLDERNRVLVSGDTVQDHNIFLFGERRDLARYIESLQHLSLFGELYDEIWPMHGTFPVGPDLIGKLLEGAREIRDGRAEGKPVKVFGHAVRLYRFPYAGFLGDL